MKSRWEAEKSSVDDVKRLKGEIEHMHAEIENAQLNYEYEKAARLKYSDLPALEKQLPISPLWRNSYRRPKRSPKRTIRILWSMTP